MVFAGMVIDMQENISETKSMDSVCITLRTVTVMRAHGMRAVAKAMARILFEVVTVDVVNGTAVALRSLCLHRRMPSLDQFR